MVKEGNKAPDFRLKGVDEKGKEGEFSLNDFRGKKIILYFYAHIQNLLMKKYLKVIYFPMFFLKSVNQTLLHTIGATLMIKTYN